MEKANTKYESVLIVSLTLGEEGIAAMVEKFKSMMEKNGTVEAVDEWGKRRLAYPINDEPEGYYVLYTFESDSDFPKELDRVYNITDGVLRSLIVCKDA